MVLPRTPYSIISVQQAKYKGLSTGLRLAPVCFARAGFLLITLTAVSKERDYRSNGKKPL